MRYPNWVYEKLAVAGEVPAVTEEINSIIETIVAKADKARKEGILALEEEISDLEPPLFRLGLLLVVDGNDPEIIGEILLNALLGGGKNNNVLRDVVIIEGVLGIQEGWNPRVLEAMLRAFQGAEAAFDRYS